MTKITLAAALLMAAAFPVSFALFNIGAVILFFSFVLRRISAKNFSVFDGFLDGSLLVFFLISLLSIFNSQHLSMSFEGTHKLLRYLLLFIAAREVFDGRKDLEVMIGALLLGGWITGLDGILQFLWGEDPIRGRTPSLSFESLIRISSSFPNPNNLAGYLCFLIPLAYALGCYAGFRRVLRVLLISSLALFAVALALTYARSAAIALVGVGLIFFFLKKDRWIPAAMVLMLIIGALLVPQEIKTWAFHPDSWKDLFVDHTRSLHHETAWNMIAHRPLLGVGLNTFDVNYGEFHGEGDPFARWSAHQAYLQMASETGLLGLGSFLIVLFAIVRLWWRGYRAAEERFFQASLLGWMGGFIAFLALGFYESNLWQPRQTNFFWFWTGLMCGISRLSWTGKSSRDAGF